MDWMLALLCLLLLYNAGKVDRVRRELERLSAEIGGLHPLVDERHLDREMTRLERKLELAETEKGVLAERRLAAAERRLARSQEQREPGAGELRRGVGHDRGPEDLRGRPSIPEEL